ncbi:MAG: PQQ-binding-like beta-propeller repeat protein, partial [Candidatus Coatesbacteria bacterium]|nr:PQQ-binding-like beta-propeller repeat protein [Candidatus Coatesbacteria bacterium]
WDDNLYCLDSAGAPVWSYDSGGDISNSCPAIDSEGQIFFCSATVNKLFSLSSAGNFLWSYEADDKTDTTPCLTYGGDVVFASRDGYCYALSKDGDPLWSYDSGAAIKASPTVLPNENICFGNLEGKVYCLNPDGSLEWSYDLDSAVEMSGATNYDSVFVVGSLDGMLYALESNGDLRWSYDSGGAPVSPLVGRGDKVVVGSVDGYLALLTVDDGEQRWRFHCGDAITTNLAFDLDSVVVVGLDNGEIVAVGSYDSGLSDGKVNPGRGSSQTDFTYSVKYCNYSEYVPSESFVYIDGSPFEMSLYDGYAYCGTYTYTTELSEGSHHYYFYFVDERGNHYRLPASGAYDGPEVSDEEAGPWPRFMRDMRHTSRSDYIGPATCEPAWSYNTGNDPVVSSVAIDPNSRIYFGTDNGKFYCMDPTGGIEWTYNVAGAIQSSPALSPEGNVYFGSDDEYLYALSSDGSALWSYDLGSAAGRSSPNIDYQGTIYIGSRDDGHLFAINPDGSLKWSSNSSWDISSSPALDDSCRAYFGTESGYLYCLDSDGSEVWSYHCSSAVRSSPAIDSEGEVYFASDGGILFVLDSDGSLDWSFEIGGEELMLFASPLVDEEREVVYIGSSDQKFYAINTDSTLNWSLNAGGYWHCAPALGQSGRIYAGSLNHKVYCLSPGGTIVWSYDTGDAVNASCAIDADGSLLVGSDNGMMFKFDHGQGGLSDGRVRPTSGNTSTNFKYRVYYCNDYGYSPDVAQVFIDDDEGHDMELDDGESNYGTYLYTMQLEAGEHSFYFQFEDNSGQTYRLPDGGTFDGPYVSEGSSHPWPMFRHDPRHTSCTDFEGPLTPRLKWSFNYSEVDPINMTTPTVDNEGNIYFGSQNGNPTKFYSLNSAGEVRWSMDLDPCRINASAALSDDGILYIPTSDAVLYAINVEGDVQWTCQMGNTHEICSPVIGVDGSIYLGGENPYKFYAILSSGSIDWTYDVGGAIISSPALDDDGVIYFGCYDRYLYALESDGSARWSYQTDGVIEASPAIDEDGNIYFGSADRYFYSIDSAGDPVWSYDMGYAMFSSPALAPDGSIYVGNEGGRIVALHSDGSLNWSYQTDGAVQGSPFIDKHGDIYVGSNDHRIYALRNDGLLKWSYSTGDWITGSPSHDSFCNLYITSWDGMLRCFTNYDEGLSDIGVNPGCGSTETKFAYEFKYFNAYSYDAREALVYIDDEPHEMNVEYGNAHNGIFRYHTKVSEGSHNYYFHLENENGATYRAPAAGTYEGPDVHQDNRGPWPSYQNRGSNQSQSIFRGPVAPYFKWSYDNTGELLSSPVMSPDGSIYVGSKTLNKLWAFNSDGTVKWTYNAGQVHATPAIDNEGNVYFGSDDHIFYSLDPDGNLRWSYPTGFEIRGAPKITDCGTIYFTSLGSILFAMNVDGELLWSYHTPGKVYRAGVITHTGGIIVVTQEGTVVRLTADGEREWTHEFEGSVFEAAPTLTDDQRVYIGDSTGVGNLFGIDYGGYVFWSYTTMSSFDRMSAAIGEDGTLYIGNHMSVLRAFDRDGELKWSYRYDGNNPAWSSPAIDADGVIYIGARNNKLSAINSDGTLKWTYDAGEYIDCTPCLSANGQIVFGTGYLGNKIICLGNTNPELSDGSVDPTSGTPETTFTFSVHYYDANDEAPSEAFVYIDDGAYDMSLDSGDAFDGTYTYQTTLGSGSHNYYFYFEDEGGGSDRLPTTGSYDGPDVSYYPELSDGGVDPDEGTVETEFTYRVHFSDGDEEAPTEIQVFIDGAPHDLTLADGEAYAGYYEYSSYLSAGYHDYYFYAETGDGSDRLPTSGTYDGPYVNSAPELSSATVEPPSGTLDTEFGYSVYYYDADQDTPTVKRVYIDDLPKTMRLDSGDPSDGTYAYTTYLDEGSHDYYFHFEDGNGNTARAPSSDYFDGPDVNYVPMATEGTVSPVFAGDDETYTFRVRYSDADGNAPATASVVLDDVEYALTLAEGNAGDGWYEYSTTLSQGLHDYYYSFDDGDGDTARDPETGDYDGPRVGDSYEADDTCASAGAIATSGAAQERALVPSDDEDWVYFDGLAGSKYTMETSNLGDECDTVLELYESDCETLIDSDDEGGEGHASRLVYVPSEAGTYFVRVYPYSSETGGTYSLSVRKNTPPDLTDGTVSPGSGSTQTDFVYSVSYFDADGDTPAAKNVLIDGSPHAMTLDSGDAHDGVYAYSTTLSGGGHTYHFAFSDEYGGTDRLPATGDYEGPEVNHDPELANGYVTPSRGGGDTEFTYYVNYCDEDGDNPLHPYVFINESPHEMSLDSGDSQCGVYSYSTTLSSGTYTYFFEFEDTGEGRGREPESGSYDGPAVNIDPVLSEGLVDPEHGSPETEFVFSVHYYDEEGDDPSEICVYIDDAPLDLQLDSGETSDGTYSKMATLSAGSHEFYFEAVDELGGTARFPSTGAIEGPVVSYAPVLSGGCVSPEIGSASTVFIFSAHYYDQDGDAPAIIEVLLDDESHSMTLDSGDEADGVYAAALSGLSEGGHRFHFTTEDEWGADDRLPEEGDIDGPTVDSTAPASACTSPEYANGEINVDFVSADNEGGIGVAYTGLWFSFEGGEFEDSGLTEEGTLGTITFTPSEGEGGYDFYTVAVDHVGNHEAPPGEPDDSTLYDATPPSSSCESPESQNSSPIEVSFSASDADGSGLAVTHLMFKLDDGEWADSGLESGGASGVFEFSPGSDGIYYFYTVSIDNAGNEEEPPSSFDDSTLYDTIAPSSCSECDSASKEATLTVNFSSTDGDGAGVQTTALWYRFESGDWQDTGQDESGESGSFVFSFTSEGTYQFYTIAIDQLGNEEPPPSQADCECEYDATPPSSSCTSPDYSDGDIDVDFTATDNGGGIGLDYTSLWFRYEGGDFEDSGLTDDGDSGTFVFSPSNGEGRYDFYTIAVDQVGNVEAPPENPDDSTVVDTTAPSSSCESPESQNSSPIEVSFSASDAGGSGLAITRLWYKLNSGGWTDSGLHSGSGSGSFEFSPGSDGVYYFYTIAEDNAGNEEDPPTSHDDSTLYDTTAPSSSGNCASGSNEATLSISFNSADASGVGVQTTSLWYRYESGDWQDSGLDESGESGSFVFSFSSEGVYQFYTLAIDRLGNEESPPSQADCSCEYDATAPSSSCSSPTYSRTTPVSVSFNASDSGSGIDKVRLWYRYAGGDWHDSGKQSGNASGSFDFNLTGEGVYEFYTIAFDEVGNEEAPPSGADDSTTYDKTSPASEVSSPEYSMSPPIEVDFTASDTGGSGVDYTVLWYKRGSGSWQSSGLEESGNSGSFEFTPTLDGLYYFASRAKDLAQNQESLPETPDDSTLYDTQPPSSGCSTADYTNETTIAIEFTASDAGSGVETVRLWRNYDGREWVDTGQSESGESGSFEYTLDEEGRYYFYTIATDKAGREETPPDYCDCDILYDCTEPSSSASSPDLVNSSPITVTFTASDNSGGSGVKRTELWYSFEGGAFNYSGQYKVGSPGSFSFDAGDDGTYEFYTICVDNAGNRETAPGSADDTTLFDSTSPESSCTASGCTSSSPVPIDFTASDAGSGVALTTLWASYEGGSWQDTGESEAGETGTFYFEPGADGEYEFYTLSEDDAGNTEDAPGSADASMELDTLEPSSSCSSPDYVNSSPVTIPFNASDDGGCGIESTSLWFRFSPDEGESWSPDWSDSGLFEEGESGAFAFSPSTGNGLYQFYTLSTDVAGNIEGAPGQADDETLFDDRVPITFSECSEWSSGATISVEYSAAPGSEGLLEVELWFRYWSDGSGEWDPDWTFSGETGGEEEGIIEYSPEQGEGVYEFYTIGVSNEGSRERSPEDADCQTNYDPEAPSSVCAAEMDCTSADSVLIDFEAEDSFAGVDAVLLFYRMGGGWTDSGLHSEAASGQFEFEFPDGDGEYEFCTIAIDAVGNEEEFPSAADATTRFDTEAPTSDAESVDVTSGSPIIVAFNSSDADGCGVSRTYLWYQFDGGGWIDSGQSKSGESGSFSFDVSQDGTYGFYTVSTDNVSNEEAQPQEADTETQYDTTAP